MKEEQVTKAILNWLINAGWEIVCYDFPQSGTGRLLHPNSTTKEKNKGAINPDIVATKNDTCVFFENKDRFYYPDYQKVNILITGNDYSEAIHELLKNYPVDKFFYGIGLPVPEYSQKATEAENLVDFVVGVDENKSVKVLYCKDGINPFL